jgi:Animal haem peroxidase
MATKPYHVPISNHGQSTEQAQPTRSNLVRPGRFGLLFPELSGVPWTTGSEAGDLDACRRLAAAMHAAAPQGVGTIAAGFTYLGQFVDHDMTFDPTSIGENAVDLGDLVNFRTPALDLDCLYGSGPADQPFLYRRESGLREFVVGPVQRPADGAPGADDATVGELDGALYDLPRACDGLSTRTAIIGDKRNDENLVVAQLHRTMMHFHNAVCLEFPAMSFKQVRQVVMHHYQRVLLNEFLPAIVGKQALEDALDQLQYYLIGPGQLATQPFMPLEFAGAAYRFGHSMVRSTYHFNKVFTPGTPFAPFLFAFTGNGGFFGGTRYPSNWLLDWRQFFPGLGAAPQPALAIDPGVIPELLIPGRPGVDPTPLAELNLIRGSRHYKLPAGQAVAARMGLPKLEAHELESGIAGEAVRELGLGLHTPLWFYILKESEIRAGGRHLGPVGATIVAEVFVGLLRDDPESVLSQPDAAPRLPAADGAFKMADLFRFIESHKGQGNIPARGVINPLG